MAAAVTVLLAGVALGIIGMMQSRGALPPNGLAGIRTSETRRSDAAWYAAHSATSGTIITAGVLAIVFGTAAVVMDLEDEQRRLVALSAAVGVLVLVVIAGVRGHRIALSVNRGGTAEFGSASEGR